VILSPFVACILEVLWERKKGFHDAVFRHNHMYVRSTATFSDQKKEKKKGTQNVNDNST